MPTPTRSAPARDHRPHPLPTPPRHARLPRPPVPASHRLAELLRGALATALLLLVAAGVPAALWTLVGNPLPTSAPTRGWLDAELTAGAVIDVLAVVLWLVWAHFLLCVVAEFATWRRGGAVGRVPGGGVNQVLAQRLVAAVLLLAAGAVWVPSAVPSTDVVFVAARTSTGDGPAGVSEVGAARTPQQLPDAGWTAAPAATAAERTPVAYVVAPPQGRNHDCLWDIAERTLGDPLRYREVFELNRDRVQSDGSRLVDADLIRPGWVLLLPADAVGGTAAPLAPPPPSTPPVVTTPPALDVPAPGWSSTPASSSTPSSSVGAATSAAPVRPVPTQEEALPVRPVLSGGLLLSGVLLALAGRGRGAVSGRPVPGDPDPDDRLREAADPAGAAFLGAALRSLAVLRVDQGQPLPPVVAAHLSGDELVLHLSATDGAGVPPSPWTRLPGGAWRLARTAPTGAVPGPDVPSPFPLLVDAAAVGDRAVLLDLAAAPGPVSFGGHAGTARDVVTAMAVELATGPWSGPVAVHLVGFGDELSLLAPQALHTHPRVEGLLARLEGDAASGRPTPPSVVVLSGPPTPGEEDRLRVLTAGARTSLAVLCVGEVTGPGWRFHVDSAGVLDLGVLGLRGSARRLPPTEYSPWLEALRAAL